MSQPIIIEAPNGARVDISSYFHRLASTGTYEDFDNPERNKFAVKFANKLAIVAGPEAPAAILNALAPSISPEYCDHLAALWGLVDDGEDGDGAELPD
jgi:hypothetical protein